MQWPLQTHSLCGPCQTDTSLARRTVISGSPPMRSEEGGTEQKWTVMQSQHEPLLIPWEVWRECGLGTGVRPFCPHTDWSLDVGLSWRGAETSSWQEGALDSTLSI